MTTLEVRRVRQSDPDAAPLVAELKRIWTHSRHRRRGLARRVVEELENEVRTFGYRRIFLATGYTPLFDVETDPMTIGPLAFSKEIH